MGNQPWPQFQNEIRERSIARILWKLKTSTSPRAHNSTTVNN